MNFFSPQRVLSLPTELAKKRTKIHEVEYMVTEKFDGWFIYFQYSCETKRFSQIYSSAGRAIPALDWILPHLNSPKILNYFNQSDSFILIGEAIIPDVPFHIANGRFNTKRDRYKELEVQFLLHDYVLSNFWRPTGNSAIERYNKLPEIISIFQHILNANNQPLFSIVPILCTTKFDEGLFYDLLEQILSKDGEGIVAKNVDSYYEPGARTLNLIKLKGCIDIDIPCIDYEYTIGEKGNQNINLKFNNRGTIITCRLGKQYDIDLFESDKSNFIGKICQIKAMQELEGGSLREPRFVRVREDKSI